MIDDVFPILPQIPSKEPAVLMAILGMLRIPDLNATPFPYGV